MNVKSFENALSKKIGGEVKIGTESGICEKHGNYVAYTLNGAGGGCPSCMEERLKVEERTHAQSVKAHTDSLMHDAMLSKAGVPERYREKGFENWEFVTDEQQKILNTVINYAKNFNQAREVGRCLIMSGYNGTGKSHLAVAVVESVLNQGYSAMFISATEALRTVLDCMGKHSKMTQSDAINILRYPDLLVLDDVGIANDSDTTTQITYEIIYGRYHDNKPTIITTNDNLPELNQYIGVRTVDRMRENGGLFLPFAWESKRGMV